MDLTTALAELSKLRGYLATGSLLLHKAELSALYWDVCGKTLPNCNCRDKFNDALIEITIKLRKMERQDKCVLKRGVVLMHIEGYEGKVFSHVNITDDVARAYLAKYPERENYFEVLPPLKEVKPKKKKKNEHSERQEG